jgi:pyruvate/2-oxoglutarate dehydrogenase complex dihydrolipoamide acyltransferase (E2) component
MRFLEAKAASGPAQNKALVPEVQNKAAAPEPDATDAARKLAEEHGLDLAALKGSGANGRITVPDVQAAVEAGGA